MDAIATAQECAYSKSMKPKHRDTPVARCRISCESARPSGQPLLVLSDPVYWTRNSSKPGQQLQLTQVRSFTTARGDGESTGGRTSSWTPLTEPSRGSDETSSSKLRSKALRKPADS